MEIEVIGSFLPNEDLMGARLKYDSKQISRQELDAIENNAVRDIVERQIECGLHYITSGEIRRKHWANDFWFGLEGITCERVDSGRIYQPVEAATDCLRISGRISYNPAHTFFADFIFLCDTVKGRAKCRQTLPSPANLLLEIYNLTEGHPEMVYPSVELLIDDIAEAYRRTSLRLHELACDSILLDDTACGLMCDDNYTKRLLQGGVDLMELHRQILTVINASLEGLPDGMETAVYLSGGDTVVPEWEVIDYPDNIMPKALSSIKIDKFFLPFDIGNDYSLEVLRHIPDKKKVVLGLIDAHSPFPDDTASITGVILKASKHIAQSSLEISPRTGFKLSSYAFRGLSSEDQWRKIHELNEVFS